MKSPKCTWCGNKLDEEQSANPRLDESKEVICDECYREHYEGECDRCGEIVEETELQMKPGELLALWQEADGLQPGYYRVLSWPIYADGMIEGHIYTDALALFTPLDDRGKVAAEGCRTLGGRLCAACQKQIGIDRVEGRAR